MHNMQAHVSVSRKDTRGHEQAGTRGQQTFDGRDAENDDQWRPRRQRVHGRDFLDKLQERDEQKVAVHVPAAEQDSGSEAGRRALVARSCENGRSWGN